MHSYLHNIKTFNSATRHLTHVERALYRDATELYYDTEQPLPANDFDKLARRLLAHSDEEKAALQSILEEFFTLTGDVWTHDYCDEVIEKYRRVNSTKAAAGKASAEAKKKRAELRKRSRTSKQATDSEHNSTDVEQVLNGRSTDVCNHEPLTINHIHTGGDPPERKKFTPPDVETVRDYLTEKGISNIDPVHFVDFYQARGWKLSSGTKMADWKAAVRTWVSRNKPEPTAQKAQFLGAV